MTIENLGNLTLRINGPDEREYAHANFDLWNTPYDATVSVHFLTKINFDLSSDLVDDKFPYAVIIHNTGEDLSTRNVDSFDVTVPDDGYYELTTLIFPTTDYIENVLGYMPGTLVTEDVNTSIIAANIECDNKISFKVLTYTQDDESGYYNHIWVGWQDISLTDILTLLDEARDINPKELTIKKCTASAFVYDNLYKCYISKSLDLLNAYSGDAGFCSGNSLCNNSLDKYKSEIQIRDYLWMAINVIKYCIQNCQYLKALKILNCVTTCAGVCSDIKITKSNPKSYSGCGCGKRN